MFLNLAYLHLPRHEIVRTGDHILAIYPDQESKIDEAFEFLKARIQNREAIMLVTDSISREETLERMNEEWDVDANGLEKTGDIIVKGTREWYVYESSIDCRLAIAKWNSLVSFSLIKGKNGLRVFGDLSTLFKYGLSKEVVDYESCFGPRFEMPITAVCAYLATDMQALEPESVDKLEEHHRGLWA